MISERARRMIADAPDYYQDALTYHQIQDAKAKEYDLLQEKITDLQLQLNPATATWGLKYYEKELGIPSVEAKPIEERRSNVISRRRGFGNFSAALVKTVARSFTNGEVEVNRNKVYGETDTSKADFVGKVFGSTVENPHTAKASAYQTSLQTPNGSWQEFRDTNEKYSNIFSLDGTLSTIASQATSGQIAQTLFSFNLIEYVQRKYNFTIPGATTADKVAWLKANITKITANWWGKGSGPTGNKANMSWWNVVSSSWSTALTHTNATISQIARTTAVSSVITDDGFAHFLSYSDASDGTTLSRIETDFIELEVTVKAAELQPDPYTIEIKFISNIGIPPNLDDFKAAIDNIVHAHMGVTYRYRYLTVDEVQAFTIDQLNATALSNFAPFLENLT